MALCRKCSGLGQTKCTNCRGRGRNGHLICYHCGGRGRSLCYACVGTGTARGPDHGEYEFTKSKNKSEPEKSLVKIANVEHYFGRVGVVELYLSRGLRIGDTVRFKSPPSRQSWHAVDFEEIIGSMQINGKQVKIAEAGESVTVKISRAVQKGDLVYEKEH